MNNIDRDNWIDIFPDIRFTMFGFYQYAITKWFNEGDYKQRCTNFLLGLAGEVGEITDLLKKHIYHAHELDKDKLTKEIGDVLWYLVAIAEVNDISMEDVTKANLEKLEKRYPNGFNSQDSINRKDEQ